MATPEHYLLSVEIVETVQAALDELPEELRTAILLRELEGLSYEEIANGDGMPHGRRAFAYLSHPRGDRQTLTTLARSMRKAMSEQQRWHLSALADGEIDPGSVHPTLSALASNERLVAAWEGYHLIGAAMRSEQIHPEYRLIKARVSERIAAEPVPLQRPRIRWRWTLHLGLLAGTALAVCAVSAAILAVPQLFNLGRDAEAPPNRHATASLPEQFRLADPARRWHVDEPALEGKLDRFLVNHREQSPVSHMQGFLPYATLVGYAARR